MIFSLEDEKKERGRSCFWKTTGEGGIKVVLKVVKKSRETEASVESSTLLQELSYFEGEFYSYLCWQASKRTSVRTE